MKKRGRPNKTTIPILIKPIPIKPILDKVDIKYNFIVNLD
jgi:hypothetical protein